MAVKTITIDMEAYDLLARHKKDGQSFSQVIKAHFGEQPTAGRLLARLKGGPAFSQEYLDIMNRLIRDRQLEPARAVKL
jgi:predicted CopG family antitoxin